MLRFQIVLLISPAGMFGLPEEDKTIYPALSGDVLGATLDTRTGNFVAHGTLSKYRDTPLTKEITLNGATLTISDNYLFLNIEASGERDAIERGIGIANTFGVLLSIHTRRYCSLDVVQVTEESTRKQVPLPETTCLISATIYNLEELAKHIDQVSKAHAVWDEILGKAAGYFYHALFMREEMQQITSSLSFHAKLIISEVILNYYKSISTIIGDPSIDRDYQSKYKKFGISKSLWDETEKLRKLRNSYDIAHYTPDLAALSNIEGHLVFAHTTAEQIIKGYISWLEK